MAAEYSQASVYNLVAVTSATENEVLVLPSSYIPRRLNRFTPRNGSTSTTTAIASSSSKRKSPPVAGTYRDSRSSLAGDNFSPTQSAGFKYDDPTLYTTLTENELLVMPQTSQLSIIYGLPGFGSTSLMVSLIVQIQQDHPERWVSYMDLRRVISFMQRADGDHFDENNWTMSRIISAYNKITSPVGLKQIENFFQCPLGDSSTESSSPPIEAELFLDELDELSTKMQDVILKIIARDVSWKKCPVRIWISSRSHLRARLDNLFPEGNTYELLPLLRNEQINLLVNYWKITICPTVPEQKLRNFATGLHDQFEKLIPNFYKTIGACPSHLLLLPEFFNHVVTKLEEELTENHFATVDISLTKVFEKFVKTKFEAYVDKVSCEQPILAMSSVQFREKEFRKLERIHVKAIISSYPTFRCDAKTVFAGNGHYLEQIHELYRVGICYEENGEIRFIHKMYAEFILAQYFVDSGRMKNTSNMYISFFLNNILFDENCKATRRFFDAYLNIQQERKKIREVMVWTRLRCFLTKHYRLNDEACVILSSEEEDVDTEEGKERSPKLTYEDIKNNGSIVHLAVMEGHFKILQMIMDCFKGFSEELKKLLSITVDLEIFSDNPFAEETLDCEPEVHTVDAFQMLAMYGYGAEHIEKLLNLWCLCFGNDFVTKYLEEGTWTVVHYAAMNSNCHFLHALLAGRQKWNGIQIQVNQRNCEGQQPIHLVLSKCWYYSIKIRDHPHPDYKSCINVASATSKSKTKFSANIHEAINAVVIKQEPVDMEEPSLPSASIPTFGVKREHPDPLSPQPSTSSWKKCKTVAVVVEIKKPPIARRRSRTQVNKTCTEIWCFEGLEKEFIRSFDFYPDNVEGNPLQPHLAALTLLIANGGDVNSQDEVDGKTILHQAAELESVKLVQFLLQHGADINIRDDLDRSPPQYAALHGNMEVLEALTGQQVGGDNDRGVVETLSDLMNNGKHRSLLCKIS